jgi:hypothetical protein
LYLLHFEFTPALSRKKRNQNGEQNEERNEQREAPPLRVPGRVEERQLQLVVGALMLPEGHADRSFGCARIDPVVGEEL